MKVVIPDTVREHREREAVPVQTAALPENITAFRAGTQELAEEMGYPVISPSGTFVHDARAAWLVDALDAYLVEHNEPRFRPGWFSASALGRTDEELIAAYRGDAPQESHDARTLRIFSVGIDRDRTYKEWLRGCGLSVVGSDDDRKVTIPHLRLMGECDDILRSPTGFTVYEGKTINPFSFGKLDAPLPDHVLQVHAYMAGLALKDAVVLYENKGTQDVRVFYVPFDQDVWDGIAARLRRLREIADNAVQAADEDDERRGAAPMA